MSGILNIALTGLNDASVRIANAASNIVKASSTAKLSEVSELSTSSAAPQDVVTKPVYGSTSGLGVTSTTQPRTPAYNTAFDPQSADADAGGLVAVPNVDTTTELVSINLAKTAYNANAAVIKTEGKLQKTLLDILR